MDFKQLLKSWAIIAFGVLIASNTGSGIHYESREALIIAVILLSALNVLSSRFKLQQIILFK